MCSNCKEIYGKKMMKHDPIYCPISQSSYCGICAKYGHTTKRCPDKEAIYYRKPTCLEQLIPGSVLDAYGICSYTPLPDPVFPMEPIHTPLLEVIDNDKNIRAILLNYSKSDKGKMKDLRLRLQKLADELDRKLVYIKPMSPLE
jgi:hypothetical protein